jgi:hypothetical protein
MISGKPVKQGKYRATEDDEQIALFQWAELAQRRYPELALLHHIPNGGHRHPATAAKLKKMGVKRGAPDICLPAARGGYAGLYIELKVGRNTPSRAQKYWLDELTKNGYRAVVCRGAEEARNEILQYIGVPSKRGREVRVQ